MSYTLLQLVDQVSGELGLAQPTLVIGSANNQTLQLLALAQRLGKDLIRGYEWQRLVQAYIMQTTAAVATTGTVTSGSAIITSIPSTSSLAVGNVVTGTDAGLVPYVEILTVDSSTQVTLTSPVTTSTAAVSMTFAKQDYSMPADFNRLVSDTNWDRTNHRRNLGSKTSQEWQWLQGGAISAGTSERYRIYNNKLRIFAALTTVSTFSFEYVSNYWIIATGGSAGSKEAFTLDSDTCVFPDELMSAGLKMYFLRAKKLDYTAEFEDFSRTASSCKAQDVPIPAQSLAPVNAEPFIGPWSIQDGNWPQ